MKEISFTVTPALVYADADVRLKVTELLINQWQAVAFRPPVMGEKFINSTGQLDSQRNSYSRRSSPRLIVIPRQPDRDLKPRELW